MHVGSVAKKNEAILIDGVIRVEVVTVTKAAVRVRLMAPRSLQPPHGVVPADAPGRDDIAREMRLPWAWTSLT